MSQRRRIDNRRDILLLLLYSPGVCNQPNEPVVGSTRLVKMLFLFREEVLPQFRKGTKIDSQNFYQFFPWWFGPFSRQVYDDLNFFILRDFIQADESDEDTLPQSLGEWELWLSGSSGADDESAIVDYVEHEYCLTDRGLRFTAALYEQLTANQRKTLCTFKKRMLQAPLRSILKYVYERYPDQIERSEIKDQVLNSGR
ncbi:MAG: hypothetical protein KAS72_15190 [Phycisphaerales bacterium]|nr:hypothetical protein [Phycisphaerales bacterium]